MGPSYSASSSVAGRSGDSTNRSVNVVGSSGGYDSLNQILSFASGPPENGGFTMPQGMRSLTSEGSNKWITISLVVGLVVIVYLLRK